MSLTAELQRNDQWHIDRAGRLTASNFGAALGLNPYKSRQELFRELTGKVPPFTGNEMTEWGDCHEKDCRHAFEVDAGLLVLPAGFVPWSNWSGCSPDGYIDDGLVEFKCPYSQRIYEEIPDYYKAQVIGQLGITEREFCWFCVWTPAEFKRWRVEAEPKTWNRMEEALWDFWLCVMQDKEPKRAKRFQL